MGSVGGDGRSAHIASIAFSSSWNKGHARAGRTTLLVFAALGHAEDPGIKANAGLFGGMPERHKSQVPHCRVQSSFNSSALVCCAA